MRTILIVCVITLFSSIVNGQEIGVEHVSVQDYKSQEFKKFETKIQTLHAELNKLKKEYSLILKLREQAFGCLRTSRDAIDKLLILENKE